MTVHMKSFLSYVNFLKLCIVSGGGGGGAEGILPYITHIGMCRCEGYGFQALWTGIGTV